MILSHHQTFVTSIKHNSEGKALNICVYPHRLHSFINLHQLYSVVRDNHTASYISDECNSTLSIPYGLTVESHSRSFCNCLAIVRDSNDLRSGIKPHLRSVVEPRSSRANQISLLKEIPHISIVLSIGKPSRDVESP